MNTTNTQIKRALLGLVIATGIVGIFVFAPNIGGLQAESFPGDIAASISGPSSADINTSSTYTGTITWTGSVPPSLIGTNKYVYEFVTTSPSGTTRSSGKTDTFSSSSPRSFAHSVTFTEAGSWRVCFNAWLVYTGGSIERTACETASVSGGGGDIVEDVAVHITADPATIFRGESSVLRWNSDNADRCVASGGWTGTKALNGSQTVSPSVTTTYTVTCENSADTASDAVTVAVKEKEESKKEICGDGIDNDGDGLVDENCPTDGDDGKDGEDGTDGKDGEDGTDGKDGEDGTDGKDGEDGEDGTDGKDGEDGEDGTDGKDGKDGEDGEDGKDGEDGTDGEIGDIIINVNVDNTNNNTNDNNNENDNSNDINIETGGETVRFIPTPTPVVQPRVVHTPTYSPPIIYPRPQPIRPAVARAGVSCPCSGDRGIVINNTNTITLQCADGTCRPITGGNGSYSSSDRNNDNDSNGGFLAGVSFGGFGKVIGLIFLFIVGLLLLGLFIWIILEFVRTVLRQNGGENGNRNYEMA